MVNNPIFKILFKESLYELREKVLDGCGFKYDYSPIRIGVMFIHALET